MSTIRRNRSEGEPPSAKRHFVGVGAADAGPSTVLARVVSSSAPRASSSSASAADITPTPRIPAGGRIVPRRISGGGGIGGDSGSGSGGGSGNVIRRDDAGSGRGISAVWRARWFPSSSGMRLTNCSTRTRGTGARSKGCWLSARQEDGGRQGWEGRRRVLAVSGLRKK